MIGNAKRPISQTQQANLAWLERALQSHWELGKQLMLCWSRHEHGIQLLHAPYHFLGRFSASLSDCPPDDRLDALNGRFIRQLLSGARQLTPADLQSTARRLQLLPVVIELPLPIGGDRAVQAAVDTLIQRYSISYVKARPVLLFDVVNFTLFAPFEQTSQLNSLS